MEGILTEIITAVVTAVITYIVAYRKNKIENEANELTSVKTAIEIWQKTATDLQEETNKLRQDMVLIRKENSRLYSAIGKLTKALQKFDADLANEINNEINNEKT